MKKVLYTLFLLLLYLKHYGQADLPMNYGFDTCALPKYYTGSSCFYHDVGYYYSNNQPFAAKFSSAGDFISINFKDSPHVLRYSLAGNGFSNSKFSVLQSSDGVKWDTLSNYNALKSSYLVFSDTLISTTRHVKFIYVTKVKGSVGLDMLQLSSLDAITSNSIRLFNGEHELKQKDVLFIGNQELINFSLKNYTVNDLNHLNFRILGADSADFSMSNFPDSLCSGCFVNFLLSFKPSKNLGGKTCQFIVYNSEREQVIFEIAIKAIYGDIDSEPLSQPSSLSFFDLSSYAVGLSISKSAFSGEAFLVLLHQDSLLDELPLDNKTYRIGDYLGAAKVIYIGEESIFSIKLNQANTQYFFSVFAFNGQEGYENYLQLAPLQSSVYTHGSKTGNYYQGISSRFSSLIGDLGTRLKSGFRQVKYAEYAQKMIDDFIAQDTSGACKKLSCYYSGEEYSYKPPFLWGQLSREHVFAQSWMPEKNEDAAFFSDLHHLFPVYQEQVNLMRSNYPFGEVEVVQRKFGEAKLGFDHWGKLVFEPLHSHKGDIARALFYMCVRYHGEYGNSWDLPPNSGSPLVFQNQEILKKWHFEDPVDAFEIARHEYVYALQNNRNPFIDSAGFALNIDFDNMNYMVCDDSSAYGLNTVLKNNFPSSIKMIKLIPNPNDGSFKILYPFSKNEKFSLQVKDFMGNILWHEDQMSIDDFNAVDVSLKQLSKGIYSVILSSEGVLETEKFIVF